MKGRVGVAVALAFTTACSGRTSQREGTRSGAGDLPIHPLARQVAYHEAPGGGKQASMVVPAGLERVASFYEGYLRGRWTVLARRREGSQAVWVAGRGRERLVVEAEARGPRRTTVRVRRFIERGRRAQPGGRAGGSAVRARPAAVVQELAADAGTDGSENVHARTAVPSAPRAASSRTGGLAPPLGRPWVLRESSTRVVYWHPRARLDKVLRSLLGRLERAGWRTVGAEPVVAPGAAEVAFVVARRGEMAAVRLSSGKDGLILTVLPVRSARLAEP